MSLFVRAPAEYANATYKIDVSDSDTIWQIKIKAFEHIAIPPFRQSLFTLGDSNKELENDKRIRDYPQLRHVANDARLVLLKDKEATSAEPHKRAKGSRVKQKIKVVKARRFREHVSPILCFAGGRGLSKGVVGIPCTIKLFPITKEYQLIQCKDRVVFDVSVSRVGSASDDSDQSIASIMYDTDKDSAILATWIPEEAGFFSVTVKINGSTIANSPRVVTIFDHENSGKKVKTMLTDPKWLVEGVSVLSFWAGRDEYQREIFSEIGLEVILQLVNAEPQEQIKPLLGIVFEKLLEKDIAKSLILEKGGPDALVQLIEISNSVQSNTIIRFVSRAIASLSRVNTEILRDPELKKLPQFKSLIGLGSMELFRLLEKQLARQQDPEILRNITRAVANFSESKIYLPSLSDAGMFPHMLSSFEGCNDRATQRYALAAFANWANTEYPLQRKYFTDARVSQLLKTIDHPESQDSLVTEAIKVLANLAQSREFASSFSTNPNIDRVIKSLGSTDDLTAWEIKSALAILPDPANRESLRQTISHGFHQDVRFNIESLRLIGNILEFSANSTSLSIHQDAVAISNIVRFTKSIDENLQYEACRCLSLLTVYEKPRDLIVKAGGLTSLCSAINTATIQAVQFIVLALANMPLTVKGILLSLIGDAGVNKLVTLLKQDQNKNVQRGAAILLASLAGNEEFTSKKIVQEGGSTFLKNLIELVRRGKVNVQNEIDPNTVELIGVVGEGISGVVWKAKWNDQLVAVKKFDENSLSFNEEEFRSEVALMSVLRHENVVHCIGSSMQEENLFILLELFNRGSVSTVVHDLSNPLPIQRAVSLALDAAKGMKYLHSLGLIHRDLKSGNLLVTDDWHAKVADFGLSRMADKMMTRGVGTPIYTAPEALASSNYTFKADVYSFAFIMWELATRRIPYEDLAPFEAVRRACDENLRPPIPQNCLFESLIVQCWDRNPETRPDFATIVDALEEIANVVGSDSLKAYESGSEVEEEEAQYQYEKINTIIGRTLRGRAGDGSTFGSKKFASRPRSPFPMSTSSSSSSSSTPASVLPVTSSSSPIVPAASFSSLPQPVPSSSSSSSSSGSTSPAISGTKAISRSSSRRLKQSSFDATLLKDDSQDPPPPLTQQSFSNPLIQSHPPVTSTTSSPALAPSPLTAGVSSLSISEGSSQPAATRSTSTSSASASTAGEAPDNGICPTCNKEVLGQKLKAIGRTFHPDCFVCFHCKGRLQGSFCRHQDKPYCNEDYKKLFMPHCARCQQLLTSQYLNALNKSWHRECFVCTRCSGPMKAYYDVGGFPYCDNCCNRT